MEILRWIHVMAMDIRGAESKYAIFFFNKLFTNEGVVGDAHFITSHRQTHLVGDILAYDATPSCSLR